jgi:glycosyltransferase involved in cell wall biosynthesis
MRQKEALRLDNVLMLPQQPKERMPELLAASDASMVLLRKTDLFKTVIPSKIFEAMAMERPVILGVDGETKEIIEEADCGVCIEPENHHQLAEAVLALSNDPTLLQRLGRNGKTTVKGCYDREKLAGEYLQVLQDVAVSGAKGLKTKPLIGAI